MLYGLHLKFQKKVLAGIKIYRNYFSWALNEKIKRAGTAARYAENRVSRADAKRFYL